MTQVIAGGTRLTGVNNNYYQEVRAVYWKRPFFIAKVSESEQPLVVVACKNGEKRGWERPVVKAKVVEGKRPFSIVMSGNSQRRCRSKSVRFGAKH